MRRDQLAHVLRAASRITHRDDILVIGSQSILGTYDDALLPEAATMSEEADLVFLRARDRAPSDQVNVMIGELSDFHATHGVYAEGVESGLAILPHGWRRRVVSWHRTDASPASPRFLERHDLAASKLARGEEKDLRFVGSLVDAGLLDPQKVLQRVDQLDASSATIAAARARAIAFLPR